LCGDIILSLGYINTLIWRVYVMKGRRMLALLASCTLIISAFAGCNPEDEESEGTTKTSNSTTAAALQHQPAKPKQLPFLKQNLPNLY
jgi:hypothetical protein